MAAAAGRVGTLGAVIPRSVVVDSITGGGAAGRAGRAAGHTLAARFIAVAAVPAAILDIGVDLVSLARPFIDVLAKCFGFRGLLVCLLAQPRRFNLGLLRIRPGACGLRLALAGIEFPVFGLAADFRSLFPVLIVPLLLYRLPAPSARQQQQHNQHHHYYGNYYPNPWSCFQITHHFPLDVTGPAKPFRLPFLELLKTRLARVLTFY